MIRRLLRAQLKRYQLALAWTGAFTGIVLLLGAFQYYKDFTVLFTTEDDLIQPEYLVINKKISALNALFTKEGFGEDEIREISKAAGVEKIGRFSSNLFRASGNLAMGRNEIAADLFFEAIPDEFIDVKSETWNWKPGDRILPIIVPADYLRLYNFGFAPSHQLPQLSAGTVASVPFDVYIDSSGYATVYKGQIAGFSNRINSILVPQQFLDFANRNYGYKKATSPSRLIILAKDPSNKALLEFLEKQGYETNSEQLKNARLNNFLRLITSAVLVIGLIIIVLAMLGLVQYLQLTMYRSVYEIKTLYEIGYAPSKLAGFYHRYSFILVFSLIAAGLLVLYLLKTYLHNYIQSYGFEIEGGIRMSTIFLALGVFIFFYAIQWQVVRNGIRKIVAPLK